MKSNDEPFWNVEMKIGQVSFLRMNELRNGNAVRLNYLGHERSKNLVYVLDFNLAFRFSGYHGKV